MPEPPYYLQAGGINRDPSCAHQQIPMASLQSSATGGCGTFFRDITAGISQGNSPGLSSSVLLLFR